MRNADQLLLGEHHPGPQVAVVEQDIETGRPQFIVQLTRGRCQAFGLVHVNRDQRNLERRDRRRPDDAALVVMLLDRGGHRARDADAIAAHYHVTRAALLVQHGGVHGAAVLVTELKDVTHLNATRYQKRAVAVGTAIAVYDVAQVGLLRLGQVAAPVDAGQVFAVYVRATCEIGKLRRRMVRDNADRESARPQRSGPASGGLDDLRLVGEG